MSQSQSQHLKAPTHETSRALALASKSKSKFVKLSKFLPVNVWVPQYCCHETAFVAPWIENLSGIRVDSEPSKENAPPKGYFHHISRAKQYSSLTKYQKDRIVLAGLDGIFNRIQLHTSRTRKLDIKFKYHEEPVSLTNSLGPDCLLTLK